MLDKEIIGRLSGDGNGFALFPSMGESRDEGSFVVELCGIATLHFARMSSEPTERMLVGILMGSDSDWPVMKGAADICAGFEISCEAKVISAHRTPRDLEQYVSTAQERGLRVIIAGAGGAAHLPGVTAAFTTLPVIGVPIQGKALDGLDSLLSIVQMPPGVPVATVGINAAKNAGLLAVQILAIGDARLQQALVDFKLQLADESRAKNKTLTP
jgi:5-(carboxyamino)imidazole ribonucleotide mutase